jgi:TolB-like protein
MAAEVKAEIELEIAHILFIDTVGYSKLLINEQRQVLDDLNRIVRSTDCFRAAEASSKLIRLPTGDGMALVFSDEPEAPVKCALEITRAARNSNLILRMGIHSGPVSRVFDVNDRVNVTGGGINTAQRVMNCGDAGHILLSKRAADDLAEYRHWQPYLHEIGECEVKHGSKLSLINLYAEELGNPELPTLLRRALEKRVAEAAALRAVSNRKILLWSTGLLLAIAVCLISYGFLRTPRQRQSLISEKSVAVLPFDNLSDEKGNAFLTDGVQDEILTGLAKVADLRVISRTSTMQYRTGTTRNLREIAKELGVAHVVEGTVQIVGKQVRVSAQLIDARTDTHLWAEHYKRDLADIFAIESEVSERIVSQLKAKLSPDEKASIEQPPTTDLAAYDFYIRGKTLVSTIAFNDRAKEDLLEGIHLLDQAVVRDPAFFLAYYRLARAHDQIYILGFDHTPSRLALAQAAVDKAVGLRPEAGEAHLALAQHIYCAYFDYDRARQELAIARQALPNDPLPILLTGYMDRRQGRWEESTRNLEHALALDPRNFNTLQQMALNYLALRRFAEAAAILDRALRIVPKDVGTQVGRAIIDLEWRADPRPLRSTIQAILKEDSNAAAGLAEEWLYLALCERNDADSIRALTALTATGCRNEGVVFPHAWCEGVVARTRGDLERAHAAFMSARVVAEQTLRDQPDYAEAHCVLGMIDAALNRKEEAVREGRRAIELLPVSKNSIDGTLLIQYLAIIYAWTGDKDSALEQLKIATRMPGFLTYGQLRLHPYWDPLRGDRRFESLVANMAPVTAQTAVKSP